MTSTPTITDAIPAPPAPASRGSRRRRSRGGLRGPRLGAPALTKQAPDRIAHTHLKDVDSRSAGKVRSGRLSYTEAVADGMYRPLGTGDVDVDVEAIVTTLQGTRYAGWYTLERDTILIVEPRGDGPVSDVRTTADYDRTLLTATAGSR